MRTIRAVSSARARKLRRLGERVWWDQQREALVWDMAESKRIRRARVRRHGRWEVIQMQNASPKIDGAAHSAAYWVAMLGRDP